MPELAEVETVKNTLKMRILHKEIVDVKVNYSKMLDMDAKEFQNILVGNEFQDILRVGKWLVFELKEHYLLSHLRMEGKFFIKKSTEEVNRHEHILISFADGMDLRYHDTRKFGRMKIVLKDALWETEEIKKQGREPISDTLTVDYLLEKFQNKRLPIKTVLLDQEIISGLGNIYADEVLFASKINPLKKAGELNSEECERIIKTSKEILLKAIAEVGNTIKRDRKSVV